MKIKRTNSSDPDFKDLVTQLDLFLQECYGETQSFYDQFNKIKLLNHVVVAYHEDKPVGCGAFKKLDDTTIEIKRMYVDPEFRQMHIGSKILEELENWGAEWNFKKVVLETGKLQPVAIKLYEKKNYKPISNYGQYAGVDTSICMEKSLIKIQDN